jgi:hypothetical protein
MNPRSPERRCNRAGSSSGSSSRDAQLGGGQVPSPTWTSPQLICGRWVALSTTQNPGFGASRPGVVTVPGRSAE